MNIMNGESNNIFERIIIARSLFSFGIFTNIFSGKIHYMNFSRKCKCKSLRLLRHCETIAVKKGEFMNNESKNSCLTSEGIKILKEEISSNIKIIPDIVFVAPLKRTLYTYNVFKHEINCNIKFEKCNFMLGIDNSIWGGKSLEMLDTHNLYIFIRRELFHDIFAKTKNGDSWGDVLMRCVKLLNVLNRKHKNENVLLISQGSVAYGLNVLLHKFSTPWSDYNTHKMFFSRNKQNMYNYGKIITLWNSDK